MLAIKSKTAEKNYSSTSVRRNESSILIQSLGSKKVPNITKQKR